MQPDATLKRVIVLDVDGRQSNDEVDADYVQLDARLDAGESWDPVTAITAYGSEDGTYWTELVSLRAPAVSARVSFPYRRIALDVSGAIVPNSTATVYVRLFRGDASQTDVMSMPPVQFGGASTDAFGRLRVSNPRALFDSKLLYDDAPLFWDEALVGGAGSAHSTVNAAVTLSVAGAADSATRQTFQRFNYQPARSQAVYMTTVIGAGASGVVKRVGQFDANNGFFWEQDAGALSLVIRKGGADTPVAQADWSEDPLDGTGPSGLTFDPTQTAIIGFDYQWLGVGTVRWFVVHDGVNVGIHRSHHEQVTTSVYTSTPCLPLRYEITSTDGAGSITQICSTVLTEGGNADNGIARSASTNSTPVDANTGGTIYALVGMRLKSTHLGASVKPTSVSVLAETNDDFEWLLLLDPTVGAPFTYSDESESAVQIARGATANTITNGYRIAGGWASAALASAALVDSRIALGSSIAGTPNTIVLCARPLGTGVVNADIYGSITWVELQ